MERDFRERTLMERDNKQSIIGTFLNRNVKTYDENIKKLKAIKFKTKLN